MKKLTIDENVCLCCGSCVANWGDLFGWSDKSTPCVLDQKLVEENKEKVEEAIEACPAGAIKYEEEE